MAVCGTCSAYWSGCRCDECRCAVAAYQRERKKIRSAQITGGEAWHGTIGGHTNYGCRCAPCVEAFRAYTREWSGKNRDKLNGQARTRYAADPERANATSKRWQQCNVERYAEGQRRWRQANPEKLRAKNARRRARLLDVASLPFTADQLRQKWAYYGDRRYLCGEAADATDHVKPLAKGGPHMLANLKPICTPCNSRKRDTWPYNAFKGAA